ncbi:hypothetical protein VTN96DRAFT_8927 [Rasamsonia emersonii]
MSTFPFNIFELSIVYCYACGSQVMATRDKRVFSEKEEWKKANKKVIYCRAVELDEMSFKKNCADWAYFFRLIIWNPLNGQCQLSGIAEFTKAMKPFLLVPWDRDIWKAWRKGLALSVTLCTHVAGT